MVVSQGHFSSKIASQVLKEGGNVFDAAVALSFAISVERPQSTGLGGGGFMLFSIPGKKVMALDFREQAPSKASKNMYLDKDGNPVRNLSTYGVKSAGIPNLLLGLLRIHKDYGSLPLGRLIRPAINLARNGFPIYPHLARMLSLRSEELRRDPQVSKIFFRNGVALKEGDILIQENLARTLEDIAKKGAGGFYRGRFADALLAQQKNRGGLISRKDLNINRVVYRRPVEGSFRGHQIYSMPSPSSGGAHILQILNILAPLPIETWGPFSTSYLHYLSSAMQMAFADRARYLGDSDFVKVPLNGITSKKYALDLLKKIPTTKALKLAQVKAGNPWPYESDETTHFTLVDSKGNWVTSTQTINGPFGAAVMVPNSGVFLNNEMDDFSTKEGASNYFGAIGGKNNSIAPLKRPLSSMSPTLVFKNGKPRLALGSPSGTRILTCVAQVILNHLAHRMSLEDAVSVIRVHHQWSPDYIRVDSPGLPEKSKQMLEKMGHQVKTKNLGCRIQAISFDKGQYVGVSDLRGEGRAVGN